MPQQSVTQSIAANTTVTQDLGRLRQLSAGQGRVRVYAIGAATGVLGTLLIGQRVVQNGGHVNVNATARIQVPEDLFAEDVGVPGDQITLQFENTTGAAIITTFLIVLD